MGAISPFHVLLVLAIALIVLGPGKLPDVGSAVGKSIREFRRAVGDGQDAAADTPSAPSAPAAPYQMPPAPQFAQPSAPPPAYPPAPFAPAPQSPPAFAPPPSPVYGVGAPAAIAPYGDRPAGS